jgi:antitoxin MazE
MQTYVTKWGNSLAIRLPKALVSEIGLAEGSSVELRIDEDRLIIEPRKHYKLAELVRGITERNCHAAVDDGPSKGSEQW